MTQSTLALHILGIAILIQIMMELYVYGKRTRRYANTNEPQGK